MTVRSSGTRWISSITTVSLPGEPASSSRRRSGRASRLRCSAGSSRSRYRASGSRSRNHVDLPVPRGPSRKQLWSGIWKNRLTSSILSQKMEIQIPIFASIEPRNQPALAEERSRELLPPSLPAPARERRNPREVFPGRTEPATSSTTKATVVGAATAAWSVCSVSTPTISVPSRTHSVGLTPHTSLSTEAGTAIRPACRTTSPRIASSDSRPLTAVDGHHTFGR